MKIIIFILMVCLSSLEAASVSSSTQGSTEKASVSGTEKCSADDFVDGIEKIKQIQGLKDSFDIKNLEERGHEFQEKDYDIWKHRHRLTSIFNAFQSILLEKLNATVKGRETEKCVNEDAKKQYLDVCDNTIMPFFKCIINKKFDTIQDESSDFLDPELSKNLTDIQKQVDSLANDFNNEENGLTERDLSDQSEETKDKFEQIVHSLCLKKKQTESRLDKEKIDKVVGNHLQQTLSDIVSYYGLLRDNNAFRQGNGIPEIVSYPSLHCSN